ncbi:MAG: RDD family protein [Dehalococcoidia bacterium]
MIAGQGAAPGHVQISYARFGRRAAGALIDVFVALVIASIASAMLVGGPDRVQFVLLYYWGGNMSGWSVGRGVLGTRVIGADGRAPGFLRGTFRTFGVILSLIPFGAGYLAAIRQAQGRTWHDLLAGTYVVSAASADSIAAGASPPIADADPPAAPALVPAAALPSAAQRCADCGTAWTAPRLDADIASLAALLHQVARWRDDGTLAAATADALIGRYAALLEALRTPAVSAVPERIEIPAAIVLTEPAASSLAPAETAETGSPTPAFAVPEPAVAATATPTAPPAPAPVLVRGPSWSEVGIAFLAENTLQVLLYLGAALVLAATFSLTVLAFRVQASIWTLEALLIAGGLAVFGAGVAVRYRRGLRLSGGVLMDIGALFVPLAIGTWAYEAFGARPGSFVVAGVAVEAPLNWLLVGGLTTPLYAILVLRYRLVILAYATTVFAAVAMGSVVWLTAVPWEWRIAACAILAPGLVAASRWVALRSTDGIEAHLS